MAKRKNGKRDGKGDGGWRKIWDVAFLHFLAINHQLLRAVACERTDRNVCVTPLGAEETGGTPVLLFLSWVFTAEEEDWAEVLKNRQECLCHGLGQSPRAKRASGPLRSMRMAEPTGISSVTGSPWVELIHLPSLLRK